MSELMISVAGIRGIVGDSLTPEVVTRYAAAFGKWLGGGSVMLGTDSRPSREMVKQAAIAGLTASGCTVTDLGITATPTIQLWTEQTVDAVGGIALTASHNPIEWNALKLFDHRGRFLDVEQGAAIQEIFHGGGDDFIEDKSQSCSVISDPLELHVHAVLGCSLVERSRIWDRAFKVAVDGVGGAGGPLIVRLLEALGCQVFPIGCEPTGEFHRNPEPLPEALGELSDLVRKEKTDIGFALDPDGDRLAVVNGNGKAVGEEYTVTAAVDYVLRKKPGPVVVNLSTTRAVDDVAAKYGAPVTRSLVGESHVAAAMEETGAVIGGEGNGGVMFPEVHTARDAAVGMALILQSLAESGKTSAQLFRDLPQYTIIKEKMKMGDVSAETVLSGLRERWAGDDLDDRDGLKRVLPDGWVQVRASNTEPILRVFAEAASREQAAHYMSETKQVVENIVT